jgi:hypothetical protein
VSKNNGAKKNWRKGPINGNVQNIRDQHEPFKTYGPFDLQNKKYGTEQYKIEQDRTKLHRSEKERWYYLYLKIKW